MINRCSPASVEKSSFASFDTGSFRVRVAILRNSTAAKERVYDCFARSRSAYSLTISHSTQTHATNKTSNKNNVCEGCRMANAASSRSLFSDRTVFKEVKNGTNSLETHSCVLCTLNLFHESHQQHIGPVLYPIIVQLIFRLAADRIVGRGQAAQQLGQRSVHLGRKQRHPGSSAQLSLLEECYRYAFVQIERQS